MFRSGKKGKNPPSGSDGGAKVPLLIGAGNAASAVSREQERFRSMLEEFMGQQRLQQERFIASLINIHSETLNEIKRIVPDPSPSPSSSPRSEGDATDVGNARELHAGPSANEKARNDGYAPLATTDDSTDKVPQATGELESMTMTELEDQLNQDEGVVNRWIKCSGLHTVKDWVTDYQNHPAGWAALLMIHGIPEVAGRLRSKVDNFAIYSALFLSMSLACLASPADSIVEDITADYGSFEWWHSHIVRRTYVYGFGIGTCLHTLCIMLGMAFNGALNETARDSDVFRMFSKGEAFAATVKSEVTFFLGCAADYVAVLAGLCSVVTWQEVLIGAFLMIFAARYVYKQTKNLLFSTASIVNYWRTCPDDNDPFDLQLMVDCFVERCQAEPYLRKVVPDGAAAKKGVATGTGEGGMKNKKFIAAIA
eukprot:TRINITY_DN60852_c0_g1_i1.p1 TRINITY_DN60852_c0_g1~~TRINITY_DN60852_c0_g1_i1.p1  ORF type:complete len:425 (+),score=64.37 TRINITY_DN60852_c0_g1_i1:29-1303(+)